MEKVQVISLKPLSPDNEDCISDREQGPSSNEKDIVTKNAHKNKSASLPPGTLPVTSTIGLRKDKYNSSFKNAFSRVSLKNPSHIINSDKAPQQKSGLLASTNCFGRSELRASYNEKIKSSLNQVKISKRGKSQKDSDSGFVYLTANAVVGSGLYRSNSSLELEHESLEEHSSNTPYFRREYGSHGSINISSAQQESIQSVFQKYDKDSKEIPLDSSPKSKLKLSRLWEKDRSSLFKKLLPNKGIDIKEDKSDVSSEVGSSVDGAVISNCNVKGALDTMESDSKEEVTPVRVVRRPAIAHYDCQSLAAQMSANRLRILLADRSNTTTGASAAAMADSATNQNNSNYNSCEELNAEDIKSLKSNHLVSSCPCFLNEIGGEGERIVSLSREVIRPTKSLASVTDNSQLHRTFSSSSVGVLEPVPGSSYGCQTLCPYIKRTPTLEAIDQGAQYYTTHFKSQEHQNWFGVDENLGPVAISIKKEKVEDSNFDTNHSFPSFQFRFIFRTADLFTCQGTIREESLSHRSEKAKGLGVKEAIEYICPSLNLGCLRTGSNTAETEESLIKIDELGIHKKFKVGVMYCRAGQGTEEDMYNNEHSGPAFSEFLEILGQRVRLKDFDKHRGGLDKKTDSTGHYSVYTQYQDCEIMFHVSTLLPFTPNNRKQLLRKRHIGNDIVTIIFQEPGSLPFTPKHIRSHFQHVFIVVQAINPCTDSTHYSVSVSRFQDVPMFGPPIPENYTFPKSKKFVCFLLAKVINGELAALRSEKFVSMAARTKHEYLKDLALNHASAPPLDTASKFSLIGFSRASKKEKNRFKFVADASVKGAVSWNMSLYDATLQRNVDCIVGLSLDTLVVVEVESSSAVISAPCKSVLGWSVKAKLGLHIFYHQGECLILNVPTGISSFLAEEILNDIVARLAAVTPGAETQEFVLKRNSAGLLGFNVQQDGIITEVEPYGLAAQTKLLQGSRLVEICTVALATLSQEQMVDLLKTSVTVTVTVIPPHPDGTARRGCNVPTCSFLLGGSEGDYENLTPPEGNAGSHPKNRLKQLSRYDRSLSPPRSGSSSGYGTGSSSHSFSLEHQHKGHVVLHEGNYVTCPPPDPAGSKLAYLPNSDSVTPKYSDYTGTMSSTSSGHSNDRWVDARPSDEPCAGHKVAPSIGSQFNAHSVCNAQRYSPYAFIGPREGQPPSPPPPPLPVRVYQHSKDFNGTYRVPNPADYNSEDKASPYLRQPLPASALLPHASYEQNYAVPTALSRPIPKAAPEHSMEGPSWGDYESSSRLLNRSESRAKQNEIRRNSSPLALDSREDPEEVRRREALNRTRHSIPKSSDDRVPGPLNYARSEDELSGSSGSSPRGFQKMKGSGGSTSSPSISSRNQSPHTTSQYRTDMGPPPPPGAVRLKHGVQKNLQHRNSASLASSNLQEELLKLINPDYLSDSESMGAEIRQKKKKSPSSTLRRFPTSNDPSDKDTQGKSTPKTYSSRSPQDQASMKNPSNPGLGASGEGLYECLPAATYQTIGEAEFSSRKSVFTNGTLPQDTQEATINCVNNNPIKKPQQNEDFVLTARPATVISNASTASSPAHFDHRDKPATREATPNGSEAQKPRGGDSSASNHRSPRTDDAPEDNPRDASKATPLPPGSAIDDEWSSLVNTATIAIESHHGPPKFQEKSGPVPSNPENAWPVPANPENAWPVPTKPENAWPVPTKPENAWPVPTKPENAWPVPSNPENAWPSSLVLTSAFMNSVPEEFHPHMPAYFEKFLASSSSKDTSNPSEYCHDSNGNQRVSPVGAPSGEESLTSSADESTRELIESLKKALETEQRISGKLQQEVKYLRNENSKLLQDSRAAAQQLHQFTEWFFKNVHKT